MLWTGLQKLLPRRNNPQSTAASAWCGKFNHSTLDEETSDSRFDFTF